MAADRTAVRVLLWGQTVGAVAEDRTGQVAFEYDPTFRRSGLELSPRHLPLQLQGPVSFPELRRLDAFMGLPGVLADALPDRFGTEVIRQYFTRAGTPALADRPIERLLYVGARAMGALAFAPPHDVGPAEEAILELRALVDQTRAIVEGRTDVAVAEIMQLGASAGGARPKALVLWNPATDEMRSAYATPRAGDEHWIIKFDGVGELGTPNHQPQPYNRIEYAYTLMAEAAGITTPPVRLHHNGAFRHLMTRRFDRTPDGRLHYHSLGGMDHADYNAPGAYSYERFLLVCRDLGLTPAELDEAYARAVFNLVAVNQDDHVKNLGFLMDRAGRWRLAPAFDLTFAKGAGFTRQHQMTLGGKADAFSRDDLLAFGASLGVKRDGALIVERVIDAVRDWRRWADVAEVPQEEVARVAGAHRCYLAA